MRRRSFIVRSAARMTLAATAVKIGYVPVNGDRRLAFESVADDIAELAKLFGIENAEVVGYSLGAAVALRTTVGYANLVRKLVLVSTAFKRDGWYPEILAGMAQVGAGVAEPMKQIPMFRMTFAFTTPRRSNRRTRRDDHEVHDDCEG